MNGMAPNSQTVPEIIPMRFHPSDLTMPGLSGVETLRRMRLSCPGLPVLMISGYTETDLVTVGTARTGGGAYKRSLWQLWIFGDDGLFSRVEHYDGERGAEAAARFDELCP